MTKEIKFYDSKSPFFEFSNYYSSKIAIDGKEYPSSEHYYQSQKFALPGASLKSIEYANIIASAKTANISRELASQKIKGGYKWRTDLNEVIKKYKDITFDPVKWDEVKDNVMRKAVFWKFKQNKKLFDILSSTKTATLIENSTRDSYWGLGKDEKGENKLGKILMETRYILSNHKSNYPIPFIRSNWIIPGILLASAYPGSPKNDHTNILEAIIASGINSFVNLMETEELEKYKSYSPVMEEKKVCTVKDNIFYAKLPIPDRMVVSDDKLKEMANGIILLIQCQRKILIHCFGGKGRTSSVVCTVLCELYGITGEESITIVKDLFLTRQDKQDKGKVKHMLTKPQKSQILRMYGPSV